jgi:hypothetical protein
MVPVAELRRRPSPAKDANDAELPDYPAAQHGQDRDRAGRKVAAEF